MNEYLPLYVHIQPTSWAYLSSLLAVALYFKFNRLLSLRNIDLILLILLAPGLIMIEDAHLKNDAVQELHGYLWLFSVGFLFFIRMIFDSSLVRRPLLEANLTKGGMIFLGVALFMFLSAKVLHPNPAQKEILAVTQLNKAKQVDKLASEPQPQALVNSIKNESTGGGAPQNANGGTTALQKPETVANSTENPIIKTNPVHAQKNQEHRTTTSEVDPNQEGPGFHLFYSLVPNLVTPVFRPDPNDASSQQTEEDHKNYGPTATIAILSHLAIVIGILLIGYLHFENINSGIAAALMYLLLPYTVIYIGWVRHMLPAALMIWAVVLYRRPLLAGILIGLASGTVYYPIFLLPLWASFYWQRGKWRFASGVIGAIVVLGIVQAFYVGSSEEYLQKLKLMLGIISPTDNPEGFWSLLPKNFRVYRITVLVAHISLCISYAIWPVQKNLGTLMSGSAAVMISTQFWAAYGGGISIGWYLPLLLLSIFRPNLEDRVALRVLGDGWLKVHRTNLNGVSRAA